MIMRQNLILPSFLIAISLLLNGCSALSALSSLAGGSSASQSGGVQVNTEAAIGDNKKKNQAGDEVNVKDNKGNLSTGDQSNYQSDKVNNLTVNSKRHWLSEFQSNFTIIAIFVIFVLSFLAVVTLFMRSPNDKSKIEDDKKKIDNDRLILSERDKTITELVKIIRDKL